MADPFFAIATRVLHRCATILADTELGAPAEQFVSHGSPADDCCDGIGVYIERIRPTTSFPGTALVDVCDVAHWAIDLAVHVVRPNAPTVTGSGAFPTDAQMNEHARLLSEDLQALRLGLRAAHSHKELLADPSVGVVWGMFSPYGPAGQCAGWDLRLSVEAFC